MKNKKVLIALVSTLFLAAVFVIGTKVYQKKQTAKLSFLAKENSALFVPEHAVRMGVEDPVVYLVEFLDPECESCREFNPMVKSLVHEFKDKVQLVVRYAPFHGNSIFIIKVLEAARKQNKYWETLDILFQHQPEWGNHHHPRPELVWNYLPQIGLDIEKLKKDMEDPAIMKIIEQDQKDGMTLQIQGTPTFFVNGKQLMNFGFEQLWDMINTEIKSQEQLSN